MRAFIIISMHLEIPQLTEELLQLCYQHLPPINTKSLSQDINQKSFKDALFSPTFQNEIAQMRILD
ncbi:hypothetical protein [Candidatus Tisiphia endosymbiont of Micropterix aruncella]|uniref:hypothetical protein n=1 Tax=Candidatus Tisiphia endosymbiont of Micropterix aruncella TaxID=3066271 RepID=UPI003AA9D08E